MWIPQDNVILDFRSQGSVEGWNIVNDVVMGGRSKGSISYHESGYAIFQGNVSLENNGGFSSAQFSFPERSVGSHHAFLLRLKGDGKKYQFRVRSNRSERHAYTYNFDTSGDWQTIEVPMDKMSPTWRGMRLDLPAYPGETLAEIAFLIGNNKPETFKLQIESIQLSSE